MRLAGETTVDTVAGAAVGSTSTSGDVTGFTVTDGSVTDLAGERGVAVGQTVEYLSGGVAVSGVVSAVSGNVATIAFRAGQARTPDAGTAFTFRSPPAGGIEIAGNVGEANGIENIQLSAAGSVVPIFDSQPVETAVGESLTTSIVGYDSLGTAREITLTFESAPIGETFTVTATSGEIPADLVLLALGVELPGGRRLGHGLGGVCR